MTFGAAVLAAWRREHGLIRRSGWDLCLLFILPPLAIVVLAATFHAGVFHAIPVAVVDMDHSALSRSIKQHVQATPSLEISATPADLAAAQHLMRSGDVYSVIYIPPGLEARAVRQEDADVVVYFNAALQTVASQAADAAQAAIQIAINTHVSRQGIGKSEPAIRLQPPTIQVSLVGNPEKSLELFLETLTVPLVLNMLLACALVFAFGREFTDRTLHDWYSDSGGRMLAAMIGKAAPYVLMYWLWCVLWMLYLGAWRGWTIQGVLPLLLTAQLLFFCGTAAISALLVALLRKLDLALSVSCFYTGSGLSFADATLPINGSSWFTQAWTAFLPSTSYVQVQAQQWIMASPVTSSLAPLAILALFVVIPVGIARWRLRRLAQSEVKTEVLYAPPTPPTFFASFEQTLRIVARNLPILSMVILAVVLYGFYYPVAYKVQTAIGLPVAVVDLDQSPLSRSFLRNLNATREVDIVAEPASLHAARQLLRSDQVDGVVAVADGLERSVLRGTPGGINAWLKGAYLVRARYLGQALRESIQGSVHEVVAPIAATVRGASGSVGAIQRPLYNVTNGYGDYVVPGVATIILQATLLFGVAMFMGLKRSFGERRLTGRALLGTWSAFTLLGSLTSFFFFGFIFWLQDYPRGGNMPALLLCVPLFSAAVTAMGLVIGSFFRRHERGVQILAGTSIPIFFLSGLSWPLFAMPPLLVTAAQLLPSTTAVTLFVQLNSMGASLAEVAPKVVTLAVLVCLFGALAWLRLVMPGSSAHRRHGAKQQRGDGEYQQQQQRLQHD